LTSAAAARSDGWPIGRGVLQHDRASADGQAAEREVLAGLVE